jgi:hypothetical protein
VEPDVRPSRPAILRARQHYTQELEASFQPKATQSQSEIYPDQPALRLWQRRALSTPHSVARPPIPSRLLTRILQLRSPRWNPTSDQAGRPSCVPASITPKPRSTCSPPVAAQSTFNATFGRPSSHSISAHARHRSTDTTWRFGTVTLASNGSAARLSRLVKSTVPPCRSTGAVRRSDPAERTSGTSTGRYSRLDEPRQPCRARGPRWNGRTGDRMWR